MNDYDAMEAINAVLEQHYSGALGRFEALQKISQISGQNVIDHAKAKEQS